MRRDPLIARSTAPIPEPLLGLPALFDEVPPDGSVVAELIAERRAEAEAEAEHPPEGEAAGRPSPPP